jgi:hypothetical protein
MIKTQKVEQQTIRLYHELRKMSFMTGLTAMTICYSTWAVTIQIKTHLAYSECRHNTKKIISLPNHDGIT